MNIYEFLGSCFVVYMACVGIAVHGWMVIAGLKRLSSRLEIGQTFEDSAVRDHLGGLAR